MSSTVQDGSQLCTHALLVQLHQNLCSLVGLCGEAQTREIEVGQSKLQHVLGGNTPGAAVPG